jgi:hypothetical protein
LPKLQGGAPKERLEHSSSVGAESARLLGVVAEFKYYKSLGQSDINLVLTTIYSCFSYRKPFGTITSSVGIYIGPKVWLSWQSSFFKPVNAEIMVKDDFFSHNAPLELFLFPPTTIHLDFVVCCLPNTAPTVFFIASAMFCIGTIEGGLLLYYRDHRSLHVAARRHLNKAILH